MRILVRALVRAGSLPFGNASRMFLGFRNFQSPALKLTPMPPGHAPTKTWKRNQVKTTVDKIKAVDEKEAIAFSILINRW